MFRSRIAEAYFNKINRDKDWKAESAGIIEYYLPLHKKAAEALKKFKIKLIGKSKGVNASLLSKQNLIIIVADDVPKYLFDCPEYMDFKKTKIIQWKIQDEFERDEDNIKGIIKNIIKKVDVLVKQLENEK